VQPWEIENVVNFGRYILIGKGLDVEWLVSQFDAKTNDEWEQQYINLREARTFFEEHLKMQPADALLLARYLIEDSATEHVYTDDINEHSRAIVKSIIKNLFGDYPTHKD
jgi:hypothetical protein